MRWIERNVDILRDMWATRQFSASQIAVYLGLGLEGRNAVIGKIHRLGLTRNQADRRAALRIGQTKGAATKRAKSERQRFVSTQALIARDWCNKPAVLSGRALADRRAKQTAAGKAFIAKVELALAVENLAFVKVEKPWDRYAHMRSDKAFHDAVAALTRRA